MTQPNLTSPHIRSIVWDLLWAFLTFGLYNIYVQKKQMQALNDMLKQEKYSFWGWLGLSLITCGIYHIYHEYRMGSDIALCTKEAPANLPIVCLGLSIFGLTLVADAIQQFHINQFYGHSGKLLG